jgi:predicted amidohydrolase
MKALSILGVVSLLICSPAPIAAADTTNGWTSWSPRDEIMPKFSIDAKGGRSNTPALTIQSRDANDFGGWEKRFDNISGGSTYRFTTWYRAENVKDERRSVIARLQWLDAKGKNARPADYALDVAHEGRWKKIELVTPVPTNAVAVEVQLGLGFTEKGRVAWDQVELVPEPTPRDRIVRAATIYHRPRGMKSAAEALEQFCQLAQGAAAQKPDIICMPEGATVVGTGKSYADVSESIPGPSTARLGALARELHSYIVAGIYERSGHVIYNTAVLMGRDGKLVGKYRKTHLPREEWEAGITPGDSYPIFQTDFGKVGLMICWDLQFPEPCRAMAAQGAEVVLLPIWGGSEVLAQARAIENHIFLISSSYDMRSFVVDPTGKILAEATQQQPVASAELHLDRKIFQPWLGDMSTRTWKERRADIVVP